MQKMLNKREKSIAYATAGVILFGVFFNFFIGPMVGRNDILNKEIKVSRSKLVKYLQLIKKKDQLQGRYGKFVPAEEGGGKDSVNALAELEEIAKAADVRIIDMRPENAEDTGAYKEAIIDLRTEGTVPAYLKFIYNIENSVALLQIKRLQLNSRPNSPVLEGSISISQLVLEE